MNSMRTNVVRLACLGALALAGCKSKEPASTPAAPAAPVVDAAPAPQSVGAQASSTVVLAQVGAATPAGAGELPPPPVGGSDFVFSERAGGVAWAARAGEQFQVIHNGRAGLAYKLIGEVVLSADGRRHAYAAMVGDRWRMVVDGTEGPPFNEMGLPVFSPDGARVAYPAKLGPTWRLHVDGQMIAEAEAAFGLVEFCGDPARLAFIEAPDDRGRGRLVIAELASGAKTVVAPRVSDIIKSPDRRWIAAIAPEGERQERILSVALDGPSPARVARGRVFDKVEQVVLGREGALAFLGVRAGVRFAVLDGREARLGKDDAIALGHVNGLVIRPDRKGFGALVGGNGEPVTFREYLVKPGAKAPRFEEGESLVYSGDSRSHAYAARRGARWFVVVDGKEGPSFDRVVSPSFSPDGRLLVYRARQDGKRFVVVADRTGATLRQLPAHEQVFPILISEDGTEITYGVKDGPKLARVTERL